MRKMMNIFVVLALALTAGQALADLDAIVFGNVSGDLHFHVETYIGGSVTGIGESSYGSGMTGFDGYSLILAGDYNQQNNKIDNGKVLYGGNFAYPNLLTGSGSEKLIHEDPDVIRSYVDQSYYVGLSQDYANSTPAGILNSVSNMTFNNIDGVNTQVYQMSAEVFTARNANFQFAINDPDDTIVINVTGASPDGSIIMDNGANFNLSDSELASQIIWNFVDADTVILKTFYGHILAPTANYVQSQGNIFGDLIVQELSGSAQIHYLSGGVPIVSVPTPGALMLAGFGVITAARRRVR